MEQHKIPKTDIQKHSARKKPKARIVKPDQYVTWWDAPAKPFQFDDWAMI